MKKIMVMLLMMVAVVFASPLFALDESPPGVEKFNSANDGVMIYDKNGLSVGAAHAENIVLYRRDAIRYSRGEVDNRLPGISGGYKQNVSVASCAIAVVCYPHGETGV